MVSTVSTQVWIVTIVGLLAIIALDLIVIARRNRTVTIKDATRWVIAYVSLAGLFAVALYLFHPGPAGSEFVAGYITEYSLSVDNLFVFVIIMARFAVPPLAQDKVLYIGIVVSLILRAVFIVAGAAQQPAGSSTSWVRSWSIPRSGSPSRVRTTRPTSRRTSSSGRCAGSCP